MKLVHLLLFLPLCALAQLGYNDQPFLSQAGGDPLLAGMVAAYSFDEPFTVSGDRTNSLSSSHKLTDKFGNLPAIPTPNFQGGADFSSGAQTRVLTNITLAPVLGAGSFTFVMWYYQNNGSAYVAEAGYNSSTIDWAISGSTWTAYQTGGGNFAQVSGVVSAQNYAQFAVFGWDEANHESFAYVNNGARANAVWSGGSPTAPRAQTTNEIRIWWESGAIDELYCWNRVLTDAEVARLWNGGLGLKYPFTPLDYGKNAASNYQFAVNFNRGGQISGTTSNAVYVLATTLQNSGTPSIWTNIYVALGFPSDNLLTAKTPVKWPVIADGNGDVVAIGNPQLDTLGNAFIPTDLTINGLTGGGSGNPKVLSSAFPSIVQSAVPATDNSLAVYVQNASGAGYDMGGVGSLGTYIGANATGGNTKALNGAAANLISVSSPGAGFYMDSRSGATTHKLYFANASTAWGQLGSTETTSFTGPFQAVADLFMTENDGGAGYLTPATADTLGWASVHVKGFSSADGQTLFNAVTNFRYNLTFTLTVTNTPVIIGNSGTLYATSLKSPVTGYQWSKNGATIAGATQSSYTIATTALSDFGNYTCNASVVGIPASATAQFAPVTTPAVSNWVLCAENVNGGGVAVSSNTIWGVDQFWNGMITDSLTNKMYSVNCFVPDNLNACSTPLLQPAGRAYLWVNHSFVNADLSVNGIVSDGSTKYFDTLVSDSVDITSVNDISYSQYFYTANSGTGLQGLITGDDNDGLMLQPNRSGNAQWYDYGPANGGAGNLHAAAPGNGYFCGTRTGASAEAFYFANSGSAHAALATGSSATSYAAVGLNVYVDKLNGLGLAIASTSSYVSIGKGLTSTDSANQFSRVDTLRVVLGGGRR